MLKKIINIAVLFFLISFSFLGCGTTHYNNVKSVQNAMIDRDYQKADTLLVKKSTDKLLGYLDRGTINFLGKNYSQSNKFFEKAISRIDDLYKLSLSREAATYVTNDNVQPYRGEDYEKVLIHYYMALNYLMESNVEDALVECRRVNFKLEEINEKYEKKNVYRSDAFVHYLMGMIYEAQGDLNDAFIAYRNSYETYENDYQKYYGVFPPNQLKRDLLRTTEALGFNQEYRSYKKQFGDIAYTSQLKLSTSGELILIWDNGLIPYKIQGTFEHRIDREDKIDEYISVAFPMLKQRSPRIVVAEISIEKEGTLGKSELFEDLAAIADKNLNDRRGRIIAKSVARAGLKYGLQKKVEDEYGDLAGFLVNIFNVATEKADTRSWITLPDNIQIARMIYPPGTYTVKVDFMDSQRYVLDEVEFSGVKLMAGRKTFLYHRTFK